MKNPTPAGNKYTHTHTQPTICQARLYLLARYGEHKQICLENLQSSLENKHIIRQPEWKEKKCKF